MSKNKNINSWHQVYSHSHRKRDNKHQFISNYHNLIQTLYSKFESNSLIDKTLINVSLGNVFIISEENNSAYIKFIYKSEINKIEIYTYYFDNESYKGDYDIDEGIDFIVKYIKEILKIEADDDIEQNALKIFDLTIKPEKYIAGHIHKIGCCSFDKYRFKNNKLNNWLYKFFKILYSKDYDIHTIRRKYLSEAEIKEIETNCDF